MLYDCGHGSCGGSARVHQVAFSCPGLYTAPRLPDGSDVLWHMPGKIICRLTTCAMPSKSLMKLKRRVSFQDEQLPVKSLESVGWCVQAARRFIHCCRCNVHTLTQRALFFYPDRIREEATWDNG